MDYLKYGKQVQQQPQKPQPQGFEKNNNTQNDFYFGDLNKQPQDFSKQPQQEVSSDNNNNHTGYFTIPSQFNDLGDELLNLFPVPVMICSCPFKYDEELKMIRKEPCSKKERRSISNSKSDNTFILNHPELERIRSWIETKIKIFTKDTLGYKNDLFITQSWLNKNKKNEHHHNHNHPNSIVSGIWYPHIHEKLPPIEFRAEHEKEIQPAREKFNIYNSGSFSIPMKMGELVLFPSNLKHSVPMNIFDEERISLSFNTWAKGDLGDKEGLTYLPMDRCV
tara:strand:- start:69 stop:905 length:837 start_codon:yes stop_codon:yes gene_type:complete